MTATLAILGATGDLTARYLLPGLARLAAAGLLPVQLRIVGVGREDMTDEQFRERAADAIRRAGEDAGDVRAFCAELHYARADVTDASSLGSALQRAGSTHGRPLVVYLALPHTLFTPTIEALGELDLPQETRLVVEKPFGQGQRDARDLNTLVRRVVPEEHVFRVDHFLAKQTVLNVLGLRFANRIFEPVWNALHVERVEIIWDETLGLEGRAGYYDRAGALQDMVQNHLLQMLALVAMEPPTSMQERDLRDRKVDLLRAVRTLSEEDVARKTVRARYTSGRVGERDLPAYVDEPGVDPQRRTETYASVTLSVDNWRWAGVPFTLRSGKALGQGRREVRLRFREVPHLPFGADQAGQRNELRLTLDPDRVVLGLNLNGIGDPFDLEWAELDVDLPPHELPPYSQVLRAALTGDPTLSIRGDEAEESWRIVDPILAAWRADLVPLENYPAGSDGPSGPAPASSQRRA